MTVLDSPRTFVGKIAANFKHFQGFLGNKIFIVLPISMLVSILDGLGLSMFLPFLNNLQEHAPQSLGIGKSFEDLIDSLGIPINITTVLLIIVVFFALKGVVSFFAYFYLALFQGKFVKTLRSRMLDALSRIQYKFFAELDPGRLQNTMTVEVDRAAIAYNSYFVSLQQGLMAAVYLSFAIFLDFQFALLIFLVGFLSNVVYKVVYRRTKETSRRFSLLTNVYIGEIVQLLSGFKYLKASGMLPRFSRRLRRSIQQIEEARKKSEVLNGVAFSIREPILVLVLAVVIWIQVRYFGAEVAVILVSLLLLYRALGALMSMQAQWNRFVSVSGSLDNLKILQEEVEVGVETNGHVRFDGLTQSIRLNGLSFSYGDIPVLKDVRLEIKVNETIAFVGKSGSGKTTLLNILTGLLVSSGSEDVLIDGVPIGQLDKASFQQRIGYMTQEPIIFDDTVFNNITFWSASSESNMERFEEVLKQAALSDFVKSLPKAGDTHLGHAGVNLSGGQKQRIAIARELYKDIDILIMDEGTSSLDSETEQAIQESMDTLKGSYTILLVAHRLSTIKNADRIVFMEEGEIVAQGSFDYLFKNVDKFRRMVRLQEL